MKTIVALALAVAFFPLKNAEASDWFLDVNTAIYAASSTPCPKTEVLVQFYPLSDSGGWVGVANKDVELNRGDSLYFTVAYWNDGEMRYKVTEMNHHGPDGESPHFLSRLPIEIVDSIVAFDSGREEEVQYFYKNGWLSVIKAKSWIEAHYLNVRLAPWHRPTPIPIEVRIERPIEEEPSYLRR